MLASLRRHPWAVTAATVALALVATAIVVPGSGLLDRGRPAAAYLPERLGGRVLEDGAMAQQYTTALSAQALSHGVDDVAARTIPGPDGTGAELVVASVHGGADAVAKFRRSVVRSADASPRADVFGSGPDRQALTSRTVTEDRIGDSAVTYLETQAPNGNRVVATVQATPRNLVVAVSPEGDRELVTSALAEILATQVPA